MGGTFAYFTDHETMTMIGTAGVVAIEVNNTINLMSDDGDDILTPGDIRSAIFEVVNMGNKSVDVRTTLAITIKSDTADLVFSGDETTQSEYDLYASNDVYWVDRVGYVPKEGATPIAGKVVEGNVIYYEIPEYSLNGNFDKYDEVETINGTGTYKHVYDFVLLLKSDTPIEWQDSVMSIDILVEAKQHENTGAGWDIVSKETVTQGSITKDVAEGRGN